MGGPTPYRASPGCISPAKSRTRSSLHGDRASPGAMGTHGPKAKGTKAQRPHAPLLGGKYTLERLCWGVGIPPTISLVCPPQMAPLILGLVVI